MGSQPFATSPPQRLEHPRQLRQLLAPIGLPLPVLLHHRRRGVGREALIRQLRVRDGQLLLEIAELLCEPLTLLCRIHRAKEATAIARAGMERAKGLVKQMQEMGLELTGRQSQTIASLEKLVGADTTPAGK